MCSPPFADLPAHTGFNTADCSCFRRIYPPRWLFGSFANREFEPWSHYVCAFRGRRDDYQVPLALVEAGRLDQLITDAYAGPALLRAAKFLPARWRSAVDFRQKPGLAPSLVRSLWGLTLVEHFRHRTGRSRAETYALIDRRYSEIAAARARETKADLLLYSPYAWEAFQRPVPAHAPAGLVPISPAAQLRGASVAGRL